MKPLLEMNHITKTFPGVVALSDVSFKVYPSSIHCLVGENGAGKSTLMKILSGVYAHHEFDGEIRFNQEKVEFNTLKDSERLGIGIIHQELALIPELSVYENIFLGHEIKKGSMIDWNETIVQSMKYLQMVGLNVVPEEKVKNLGVGQQQLVEIAKALSKNLTLLILDEPTAALNDEESENLLQLLRNLKSNGVTSIMISHKLKEVVSVADSLTVLRDGKSVLDIEPSNEPVQIPAIIKAMVGRDLNEIFPKRMKHTNHDVILRVSNLKGYDKSKQRHVVKDISFELRRGEVLGVAGLMGAGRTELAMTLFGNANHYVMSGTIEMENKVVSIKTPKEAIDLGIAYVSEDRKGNGLILIQDIKENISSAGLKKLSQYGFVNPNEEIKVAQQYKQDINIKTPSIAQKVKNLSGGNQQKVSLSKWLYTSPKILILDEPTRGIDVGAKAEIYTLINELVNQGLSIILISSELPEVLGMSDRVLVINEGVSTACLDIDAASAEEVMMYATQ
ncbi:MAG: sugar ABC transporter ATP-binding protein [Erysipelotrichaceae bacterium]|nr:sugar ABC transporter ATP-binding protein [Erysipelotrichaceae bacterium]